MNRSIKINSAPYPVHVVRLPDNVITNMYWFQVAIEELMSTKYVKTIPTEAAPTQTSCITAVRYILTKASDNRFSLPRAYVGDMALQLVKFYEADVLTLLDIDTRPWDLLFTSKQRKWEGRISISHVGIATEPGLWFDSRNSWWGIRETDRFVFPPRIHLASPDQLLSYTDSRSNFGEKYTQKMVAAAE